MPEATALEHIPDPVDLSFILARIECLFIELAPLDSAFGTNYGADAGRPANFEGWNHPQLLAWAAERGKTNPKDYLEPTELYILCKSLERKLAKLRGESNG
ncbi:hypothetical protein PN498_18205 [Oscillatoria sp. CS-180]|uniref:hypothetical protein n=1 Tax=Oscillatoria sp. CS-180 TaxID=3021720 RepID=UPI00232E3816|nr:hypothetical protein [Oscillatoria sp. CS-180]MDB9527932.1 hypothetical protein [Oscillatoria sp. CS-180]